jgi:hypothetical protein
VLRESTWEDEIRVEDGAAFIHKIGFTMDGSSGFPVSGAEPSLSSRTRPASLGDGPFVRAWASPTQLSIPPSEIINSPCSAHVW